MSTTKKLLILVLALVMCLTCFIPSTFAWYDHNGEATGNILTYSRDDLPVSGSTGLTVTTVQTDKAGVGNTAVTNVSFANTTDKIQYYKTTFDNTNGNGDVYAELGVTDLVNNEDIKLGITSPVINETGFDITKTAKYTGTTRVYFLPTSAFNPYWTNANTSDQDGYDMRMRYYVGAEAHDVRLLKQTIPSGTLRTDKYKDSNNQSSTYIYYYDLPNNATSFFFRNHWYNDSDKNKDWNRTPDLTEVTTAGVVYKLNGKNITDSYKLVDTMSINEDMVYLNKYYDTVYLDVGGNADISLKKDNEVYDENFVPDYYGKTIEYLSADTNKVQVDQDGLITGVAATGSAGVNVTTTITGECGDTESRITKVIIKDTIDQMPVAKNIPVKKGEKVELRWYVLDKRDIADRSGQKAASIYYTV